MSLDRGNSGCAGAATGLQELRKYSELIQNRRRESRAAAMDNAALAVLNCLDSRWPERQGGERSPPPLREPPAELKPLLLLLLRLSRSCPFDDIRERSAGILKMVQDRKVKIPRPIGLGPSSFIPVREILQDGLEETERQLFIEAFVSTGRLDNVTMVMGLHPQYLENFWKTQYYLLQMDGPLPYHYRHYIGLMAAARHQCSYLASLHINEFLQVGGNPEWLNGLNFVPQKMRNLNEINKILAHRPWLITKEHIENLLKTGESSWSLAELIHAVVLLTHYHSLASFVLGCGIRPEPDQDGGYTFRPPSPGSCHSDSSTSSGSEEAINCGVSREDMRELEALIERMKLLQEGRHSEEASQEEKATRFENEKRESSFVAPAADDNELLPSTNLSCFVEDADFGYKDFSTRGEQPPPTLRAQDYSWEGHGYSLINRLYPEVGQLLDEKFQVVYNLTYNTMAMHSGVDTSMLRRAIWNYIHCVFGIRYDDYDYGEVNQLLERSLKTYIKTVACYPEKTTKRMYLGFWRHFKHSEKVHINLLLLEARMQAALLYALRAITRYMT
ncbi:sestrin-2-like isoform X1 [Hypanus sabinus]|uniref:sestrin-2-like isoform X1 n=1 Tax=Hypanus sabinus TaxID=79690 RepID=UPI0028C47D65|nr:sestrin-2-like isoform X1 [Hypanus sabinus]XP_059805175.1 sestrin-2-like isoform X1 [Hypanus sabinus]